jgi:glycosyltransferase involved in cell wall biosynthesis
MVASKKKLTIGMPTYDDYDGVYFSVQALRMYHSEVIDDIEILIIDNNPDSVYGKALEHFSNSSPLIKYIPFRDEVGPANAKNQVFKNAECPYVLCMDGHILMEAGSLKKLIDFYEENPDTKNLHQGPLLYDDLKHISTHFDPVWRGQMYGIWATEDEARDKNAKPFEIEMSGCGVFSCRKDAWVGFNNRFHGFGGEEGYIQEKFRQAGHATLCLPFLRWVHRFGRPGGVKYPLTLFNKIKNYFIGHSELGLDLKPIYEHFSEWVSKEQLDKLLEETKEKKSLWSKSSEELKEK